MSTEACECWPKMGNHAEWTNRNSSEIVTLSLVACICERHPIHLLKSRVN